MKCRECIHYCICMVNSYCHTPCGYYEKEIPHEKWEYLKKHITELRDENGYATQYGTCQFILNLMRTIEKEGTTE